MKNKYIVKICVALGFFIYFNAGVLKFYMTMDIPIIFSTGEAFTVYILLMISACMIVIASLKIRSKQNRYSLIAIIFVLLVLNCSTFKIGWDSEYFTAAYVQLILSFILHNGLIFFVVLLKQVRQQKILRGDERRGFYRY